MKKLFLLLFVLLSLNLFAEEYPYIMKSTRALGMGNSYYTLSNDQYALFYNPAGLARIDDWRFDIINLQGDAGKNSINFIKDIQDVDWDNENEIADFMEEYEGDNEHLSFGTFPAFYKKNIAVGVFLNAKGNAIAHSINEYPEVATEIYIDYGVTGGYAKSFLDNDSLQIGISVKYMHRSSLKDTYTAANLVDDFEDILEEDLKDGDGLLFDVGAIYNFQFLQTLNPRIGASVNNIGMTSMGNAEDLTTTLNLSVAISPKLGPIGSHFLLELHDATFAYDEDDDFGKRIHAGTELNLFTDILAIRAGINQGYLTFGAGLDFNIIKIDYAYYTEEIGAYAGQVDDERHVIMLSLGF
jgi:hypothetical protein